MICKNCGIELVNGSKFCLECGTKVENTVAEADNENCSTEVNDEIRVESNKEISHESHKKSLLNEIMADNQKKKIFIVATAALFIVFLVIIITSMSSPSSNDNYYAPVDYNDNFGNNEVVTQPPTTETPTAATVDNIKIVYDDIIYDHYGSDHGAIKINDCKIIRDSYGRLTVYIDFEKAKNCQPKKDSFAIDMYVYDSNGTPIDEKQVCYVANFHEGEIGKKYKDTASIYSDIADSVAKIEFVGG